jgi:Tol biopolymer transport system component
LIKLKILALKKVHIAGRGLVVRQLRILASLFRVLLTGTLSEIRPDNMYQPLGNIKKTMKFKLLTLLILFGNFCYSQITEIRDGKFSPNGDKIAFIAFLGSVEDIFIYHFDNDSVSRETNSSDLNIELQYKTSINWMNNNQILFLSKLNGLSQQYILDIDKHTLTANGASQSNEYLLEFDRTSQTSYYISSINGREPAVLMRKLGENKVTNISKQNYNFTFPKISQDGNYIAYKQMPLGTPFVYSIKDRKQIKLKLPKKNTTISSWSPDNKYFLFTHSTFSDNSNFPKASLHLFDLMQSKDSILIENVDLIYSSIWSSNNNLLGYSLLDKFVLFDIKTRTTKYYNVIGRAVDWSNDCNLVLFIQDKDLILLDLKNDKNKKITLPNK